MDVAKNNEIPILVNSSKRKNQKLNSPLNNNSCNNKSKKVNKWLCNEGPPLINQKAKLNSNFKPTNLIKISSKPTSLNNLLASLVLNSTNLYVSQLINSVAAIQLK